MFHSLTKQMQKKRQATEGSAVEGKSNLALTLSFPIDGELY